MMNKRYLSLVLRYGAIALSFLFAQASFCSQTCRNEGKEGWAWASSLEYDTGKNGLKIDFTPIHNALKTRHDELALLLNTPRNIVVSEIHFVLESNKDNSLSLVTDLPKIDQAATLNNPLEKHVFISGDAQSELENDRHAKFVTETVRVAEPAKWENSKFTPFQMALDTDNRPKEQQRQKREKIADAGKTTSTSSNTAEVTSSSTPTASHALSGFIFIHPDRPQFNDFEFIVKRLMARYKDIPNERLPIKGALAKAWVEANRQSNPGLFKQLIQKMYNDPKKESPDQQIINWYNQAAQPWPPHKEKALRSESTRVFFSNTNDSEQKLFYYLDYITSYTDEFKRLLACMDRIENWYTNSGKEKARLIKCLMDYCDTSEATVIDAIEKANSGVSQLRLHEDPKSIQKELQSILTLCETHKKNPGDENFRLNRLEDAARKVLAILTALMNNTEDVVLGLKREIAIEWLKVKPEEVASMNEEEFKQDLRRLRANYKKANYLSEHPKLIIKWVKRAELFKDIRSAREFTTDSVIDSFNISAKSCLEKHPNCHIAGVVLNIHSTYDACYGCAPDLARESVRTDSFAGFFTKQADALNKANNRGGSPFFRIVYSCGKVRDDVRCNNCTFNKKTLVQPLWEKPNEIAFYQHAMEKNNQPINAISYQCTKAKDEENRPQYSSAHTSSNSMNSAADDDDPDNSIFSDQNQRSDIQRTQYHEASPLLDPTIAPKDTSKKAHRQKPTSEKIAQRPSLR